jgi:hypothetical protein
LIYKQTCEVRGGNEKKKGRRLVCARVVPQSKTWLQKVGLMLEAARGSISWAFQCLRP